MTVFVATPTTRSFDPLYVASLTYMWKPEGMSWSYLSGQPVDIARNVLAETAVRDGFTHVLFADSDATWHPAALLRLMERDLPMVTGCIYRRNIYVTPTFGRFQGINKDKHQTYDFGLAIEGIKRIAKEHQLEAGCAHEQVLPEGKNDLLEIDGCGMHFCLIKREVFEAVKPPYFVCPAPGSGEDFDFCRKVKRAGFKIYADLTVHTGHIAGDGFVLGLGTFLTLYGDNPVVRHREIWDVGIKV